LYHLGHVDDARRISKDLAARTATDWREEYLLTAARFDELAANGADAAKAGVWPVTFPHLYSDAHVPAPIDNRALELLADSDGWDNPSLFYHSPAPEYLAPATLAKRARALASMDVMAGDQESAVSLGLGLLKWRPHGRREPNLIGVLIDISIGAIAQQCWEGVVFGPPHDPAALMELWQWQEEAIDGYGWESPSDWNILYSPLDDFGAKFPGHGLRPFVNLEESSTRERTMRTRRDLMRQGVRLLYERRREGAWPAANADDRFTSLSLSADPEPKDYFAADEKIRHFRPATADDAMVIYSIGPDGTDDKAAIDYDPTNGTLSSGDVKLSIKP